MKRWNRTALAAVGVFAVLALTAGPALGEPVRIPLEDADPVPVPVADSGLDGLTGSAQFLAYCLAHPP
ncbi:hypothetical protein [Nocardia thailandica]|uniref:hypothetical protein n=1 Tax=Nocardia thailandica TaxID=257275 RepID=UPI00031B5B28|nr:hypothetical protein [Nocardia thailandica]